jgi:hypothetical protein
MAWWGDNVATCVDCKAAFCGARAGAGGRCPGCLENEAERSYQAPCGQLGEHPPSEPVPIFRHNPRAAAESDLRWYWTHASGELGLRAINIASDMLAPPLERVSKGPTDGRTSDGVWRVKTSRVVVVRGMSVGQLIAAHRARRVIGILAKVAYHNVRVLQRRFEPCELSARCEYLRDLESVFGEWGALVDYLVPGIKECCKPMDGKRPAGIAVVRHITQARDAFEKALRDYMRAA